MEIKTTPRLLPSADPSWRCEEVSVSGAWILYYMQFALENFPEGISLNHGNLLEVRCKSYFDENGRLVRYELWRLHQYDKVYWHLSYEAVYTYGSETAELTYWDETTDKVTKVTHVLDAKGFLIDDVAIKYPPHYLSFGHAIIAKYQPDASWKKIEEHWVSDHGNHKCLNVVYMDSSNEFRRFERWLCDDLGNPYALMREEHVEIRANGERYRWNSRGGYLVDWCMEPVYLTPEGKMIQPKERKFPVWAVIGIAVAVLALALMIL